MEEWASSVVKARMLKQGMSHHLWDGCRAAGQEVGNSITSGDSLLRHRQPLKNVVSGTLPSAKVPSEADCLLYPTIFPFRRQVQ